MNSKKDRELLSPFKIAVVILIEKYGSLKPKFWESESDNLFMFSGRSPNLPPKERKATCMLIANLIQGSDMTLSDLVNLVESSNISSIHCTAFLTGLQDLYRNGVEALLTLFDSVEKYCAQDQPRSETYPCLWTSLVGLHLRQLNLLFRRLGFSNVISLYKKYITYFEICYKNRPSMLEDDSHITSKGNKMSRPDVDTNTNDIDMEETSMNIELDSVCDSALLKEDESLKLSGFEEDKSKKINLFEPSASEEGRNTRSIVTVAALKTRQQAEIFIQDQLYLLLQHDRKAMLPAQLQQTLSSILKNCPDLGKGHFLSYLNFLRVREHIGAVHSLIRAYDSKLMHKELNRGGEDITRTFRYSALNMAALQAQFGHKELGLVSLEEAIKLAQECNDQILLQYALAWLYCLSDSQTLTLMKRSRERSCELDLSYLSWHSLLNYTIELAKSKMKPSNVLKRLLEPLSQTNHSRLYLEGGLGGQSALWSVQAGLWSIWGNIHLTAVCSQLVLHMTSQLTTSLFAPSNASPTCAALCNLAIILANLGEFSLSSEVLHHTQNQFPSPWEYSRLWMFAQCYITFYESLHQGLWSQAKAFVINMAAINPTYSKILEIELLIAKGAFSQALILTTDLRNNDLQLMEDKNGQGIDPEISVKALLLEAEAQAGGNNLGAALETVVNAILLAEEYSMAYLIALGRLHLSCIQLHLGIVRESKISLENGLDVILAGGAIYDQGRAKLLQAKIEVCSAVQSYNSENLTKAATMLEEAQKFFATVKAFQREKEVVYLKARVYHSCGKMAERNHSALEFRQLEQRHPSQPLVVNSCVF
ncbi:UNVERIFIED_CONTAM: hypothetical protein RMT77_011424 [Armadillidium vulgare]